jgi:hypothetical protein
MAKQKKQRKSKGLTRILNCEPSRLQENDWTLEHAAGAGLVKLGAPIPPSKDLREDAWWTIGNQLDTGSCVGWATADSVVRWHMVKANRLTKQQRLSVREVWMAAKETDEFVSQATTFVEAAGTSLKAALDIARKYGVVLETTLQFKPEKLYNDATPNPTATFYALAAQRKIASYINLRQLLPMIPTVIAWRLWLATKGPILTRLGVDATWDNASGTGGNLDVYQPGTVRGGHAVALVGYTPDRFIVRNSWGTAWGDKGYAYASIGYATAAFTESYGVNL